MCGSGQSKIGDFNYLFGGDHDVAWLDVAVTAETLRVGIFHAVAELCGPMNSLGQVGWLRMKISLKRVQPSLAWIDVLHDDIKAMRNFLDIIGAHEVRMALHFDPNLGFPTKQLSRCIIVKVLVAECFEGEDLVQFTGIHFINNAETTFP